MSSLIAEIGADSSGFERELNKVDHTLDKFTSKVSKKLNKAFGIGFFAGFVAHIPGKLLEHVDKIEEGSKKLHVTAEEYQLISAAAADAGQSVEEFTKAVEKSGGSLSKIIPQLQKYRSAGIIANQDVTDVKNFKWGWGEFGKGVIAPFAAAGRGLAYGLGVAKTIGLAPWQGPEEGLTDIMMRSQGMAYEGRDGTYNPKGPEVPEDVKRAAKLRQLGMVFNALSDRGVRLGSQKDALEDQLLNFQREQRNKGRFSFWSPQLTDRQEGGAMVQHAGVLVEQREEVNHRLENIADEIRETGRKMEANREAVSEVREEIQKLRNGDQ